jgi:2-dehydro-3-deoxyphosphogluconate aldolase / (4S)-4-hydroxy-2-oxoglutarate aldolase
MKEPRSLLDVAPVMPLLSVRKAGDAVRVARAVAAAGLPLIQIALDGSASLAAIERIAADAPEIIVGAGDVTDVDQPALARAAGAEFLVGSAGFTELRAAMRETELPHLPGVTTAAEAMELLDDGYTDMVLHPAADAGGVRHLRRLAAFVPAARFCPAGGITAADLPAYLAEPNVGCVSADWLAPADAVRRRDWNRITRRAGLALTLGGPPVAALRAL